ncbi:hypothetical protein BmR1_04g06945 [Babesia microti strain RI]|uniref:Uncharacterized protein n=1 Tax=Babesia microti (strain RI) TaxID=1133968 RepID=I7I9T2_BABMR|nr:hypothetical protein BmR1_04g06945 [Babesia microti strain RI]CCF75584.1 hypothetical protein BmR1_04g06945 [Babesia microti strain RI]|eukprot:XP_012649992.1 hypothetical protein BmR1_04g06945 [Babesia microti strain RI]
MLRSNTLCVPDDQCVTEDTTTKNDIFTGNELFKTSFNVYSEDTLVTSRLDTSPCDEFSNYFPIYNEVHLTSNGTTDECQFLSHPFRAFVLAITSDDLVKKSEDLGIDQSIDTRYSRSGFFADCYRADSMHIGGGFLDFSLRFPLIFCMIRTNSLVRYGETQRGIVPLAVNIFDRYLKLVALNGLKNKLNQTLGLNLPLEIILNLLGCGCYCIADKYDGCEMVNIEVLLDHWIVVNKELLITRAVGEYIENDKSQIIKILRSIMFDIYKQLEYKLTIPLIPFLAQNLINSAIEIPKNYDPFKKTKYQKEAYIYSRIALLDDSILKYRPSIISLAIYELVRDSAKYDGTLIYGVKNWMAVDREDREIKECMGQLVNSLRLFVDTELLERSLKPMDLSVTRKALLLAMFEVDSSEFHLLSAHTD